MIIYGWPVSFRFVSSGLVWSRRRVRYVRTSEVQNDRYGDVHGSHGKVEVRIIFPRSAPLYVHLEHGNRCLLGDKLYPPKDGALAARAECF